MARAMASVGIVIRSRICMICFWTCLLVDASVEAVATGPGETVVTLRESPAFLAQVLADCSDGEFGAGVDRLSSARCERPW